MCTVVMDVAPGGVARLLAIRDEDPQRDWDRLGTWWPKRYPGVIGIRDRRAGGAWMAANPAERRVAVLLNRADMIALPEHEVHSRGYLALDSVTGTAPADHPRTHGFNLLEVGPEGARVVSWNGVVRTETAVDPGVHMIAHGALDDPETPRIAHWLTHFQAQAPHAAERWWDDWVRLLAESAAMPPEDDRAIIRDNRPHGYPTLSLLYAVAETGPGGVRLHDEPLATPGRWGGAQ